MTVILCILLLITTSLLTTIAATPNVKVSAEYQPVFGPPINLSNDSGIAEFPNVQNVGNREYVAWTEGSGGIKLRESPDSGATWNPPLNQPALNITLPGGTSQHPLI